jgi:hypothetical protein
MDAAFVYSSDCNAHLTVRIKDALSTVDGADVFHDLTAALPLGISDSGVQAPFENTAYHTAIHTHNTYTCGVNLFWSRFDFSPNPGVPIRMAAIDTLVDFYLAAPSPMPRPVVITINDLDADPLSHRGALRAISP